MGTRAMVAVQWGMNGPYELYYRHLDGYPTGLGVDLIRAIHHLALFEREESDRNEVEQNLMEECGLEKERIHVNKPEEAFLKVQGDLEYVYSVELDLSNPRRTHMTIYRTSNPWTKHDFAFPIWGAYQQFMPNRMAEAYHQMEMVQSLGTTIVRAIREYEKAKATVKAET